MIYCSPDNSSLDHSSHESVGSLIGKTLTLDVQDGRVLGSTEMGTRMPFICEGDPAALAAEGCEGGDAAAATAAASAAVATGVPDIARKKPTPLRFPEMESQNYLYRSGRWSGNKGDQEGGGRLCQELCGHVPLRGVLRRFHFVRTLSNRRSLSARVLRDVQNGIYEIESAEHLLHRQRHQDRRLRQLHGVATDRAGRIKCTILFSDLSENKGEFLQWILQTFS